ncbi:hypothetical protein DSO57_1039792 [Entomophthora muscae]|uniref:Uncharacterized protein n=2 Tax=Entomophthora muscae TaxID=34485 RepID=A0ACC2URY5_9FUNG|nr:hypothetical protein DSO57_1039792 [Entomophthora muscae]
MAWKNEAMEDLSPASKPDETSYPKNRPESTERAPRSWIFLNNYARRELINGSKFIICQVSNCNKSYSSKGSTTTNLARHLKIVHGLSQHSLGAKPSSPAKKVSPKLPVLKSDIPLEYSNELNEKLLDFILSSKLPISILEDKSFQNLAFAIQSVAPNTLQFPSSDSMMSSIVNRYQSLKPAVHALLQQQPSIALSVSFWVSPCRREFMEITAHFIDKNWSQKEVALGLELLQDPSQDNEYAILLLKVIDEYSISRKIFTITTDTQARSLAMVHDLELIAGSRPDFHFTRGANHLPCVGSIVNYAANSTLVGTDIPPQQFEGADASSWNENVELTHGGRVLNKLRLGLVKIKNSAGLMEKYQEFCRNAFQTPLAIEFNIATDWRSTFSLISLLQKTHQFYNALCEQCDDLSPYRIEHGDLEHLEILSKLLEYFERLTAVLSTSRFPSVSRTIPNYDMLLIQIKTIQSLATQPLNSVAKSCGDKLERYLESASSPAFLIATAVDPRLKYEYWDDAGWDKQAQEKAQNVVSTVWSTQFRPDTLQSAEPERAARSCTTLKKSRPSDELARYTTELAVEDGFENGKCALDYWKVWTNTYPNLSEMARYYLALPATCAPTQRLFSKSGMAHLAAPSGMEPAVMKQMALLSSWKDIGLNL